MRRSPTSMPDCKNPTMSETTAPSTQALVDAVYRTESRRVFGSIGTAVYRSKVGDAIPADLTPAMAASVRDTLGGAVAAVKTIPAAQGTALLEAARNAFTLGFQATIAISIVILLATAIVVLRMLRRVPAGAR